MIMSEPYGVVGAITPWNFPVSMAGWKLGPALAAGNAVVLKPSEMTPFSTLYLAELAMRAGLPAGLINVVLGDGPTTGTAMTGHPEIAKVSFTGSTRAGSAIMENIARTGVKPMTLELGGKSPQIVFADADLDKAADGNRRQHHSSTPARPAWPASRLIVETSVADSADGRHPGADEGGPARPDLGRDDATIRRSSPSGRSRRIDGIVRAAIEAGAECLAGGSAMDSPGYFYEPTLIANVDQANRPQSSRKSSARS